MLKESPEGFDSREESIGRSSSQESRERDGEENEKDVNRHLVHRLCSKLSSFSRCVRKQQCQCWCCEEVGDVFKRSHRMTHSREILQVENSHSRASDLGKKPGFYMTRKQAFLGTLLFVSSIIVAAWLAHYFTAKNLKKEELPEIGSQSKDEIFGENNSGNGSAITESQKPNRATNVRLPTSVVPLFYEIKLIPFILVNNFTFNGQVRILVNVTQNTNNVTLHANDLEIDGETVEVTDSQMNRVLVQSLSNDTSRQFFVIHTKDQLISGRQYEIKMKFVGHLNDELQGFYRSSYTAGNGTRWIATTQFQATDARRAFPCFDEPALKARFKLHIARPVSMSSISNMPQMSTGKRVDGLPDYVWDEYQESVPMSTYLVAFVVSDFSHLTSGEKFSVWARNAAIGQAKYSLEIGPKILKYFEEYFGVEFPLPKVDMIALPDFAAGAMENWGLITFRETAMLYDPEVSSSNSKQRVATVISHELAHQWFGNLVTPSWWSDLWLNEGFASYVEYLGVEAVEPSWKIMEQFVTHEVQNVFALDALRTSHQISIEVHHPDEISEIFDRISYGKGASLIRMMDHFLTTDVFKKGLTKYLKRHKFRNSEQDDLWAALTEQAHESSIMPHNTSVKTVMDTWTLQTGFPVVTVSRDYRKNSAVVSQERFLLYKSKSNPGDKSAERTLWWVPITYTTSQQLNFKTTNSSHWMKQEERIVINDLPGDDNWVLFNIQQTGFYRVNYDEKNWKMLIEYLKSPSRAENIHPINRAQLIDDALNLARAELLSYDIAMNVTRYLSNELEYLPWKSAFTAFSYMDDMLIKTAGYDKFKLYMLKIIEKLYDQVGFKNNPQDPQLTKYKRIYVLSWACALGHLNCVKNSVSQFQDWKNTPDPDNDNPITPDLKSVVYCTAIRTGNEHDWNFAWERYKRSNVASEKDLLLEALGCSRDVWILSRAIIWAVTENSGIRKQDMARLFSSISDNPIGQDLVFDFVTEQWDRLKAYLGNSLFSINNIMKSATKTINTKSQLKQLVEFASKHKNEFGPATRTVDQAIEQADANIRWMTNNYNSLVRWLSDAVR